MASIELPPGSLVDLLDWRRRVSEMYTQVRASGDPEAAWARWRAAREDLYGTHPQAPVSPDPGGSFAGLRYFDHDPAFRVAGHVEPRTPERFEIAASGRDPSATYPFTRFATVRFELDGRAFGLDAFWLDGYAGGLFLPFRDATSGRESYGAGRYLLDTAKGSDLGANADGSLVLDFNFAYNPSCSYDPRWVCPLAPPGNRLDIAVLAGERHVATEPS